jgi:hypothetical protein
MKPTRLLIFLFLLSFMVSCIIIRKKTPDDYSSELTREDSASIVPFNASSMKTLNNYKDLQDIRFQVITAEGLRELIPAKPFSWVVIISSWCGASYFAVMKYSKMMESLPADSLQFILISQDLNLKYLKAEILKAGFRSVPFLIDPVRYGNVEHFKQANLMKEVNWNIPVSFFADGGIPKNIILDDKMNVRSYMSGDIVTSDTIAKYTGLKKRDL